jgi:hypothetical protein
MRLRPAGSASASRDRRAPAWWLGALLAVCLVGRAPAQAQPFVYVANAGSARVSQYDATAGALSPLASAAVAAGKFPIGVAVSPDAKRVYFTNNFDSTVSQYDVGSGGALARKTPPPCRRARIRTESRSLRCHACRPARSSARNGGWRRSASRTKGGAWRSSTTGRTRRASLSGPPSDAHRSAPNTARAQSAATP